MCDRCDYAANVEKARSRISQPEFPPDAPPEEVATPGVETIDALAEFLGIDPRATAKAMPVVAADGTVVLALVRGDRRLHELKLRKALGQDHRPATPEEIEEAFGAKPGLDRACRRGCDDYRRRDPGEWRVRRRREPHGLPHHGLVLGRDYQAQLADLHVVEAGDGCPLCGGTLRIEPAIEIGNIFKLGTKYAEALGATYLDEGGKERPIVMGSYGIGPARIVAAALEQSHDDAGCIWPAPLAPFDAWLVPIGDEAVVAAQRLEDQLAEHGLTVMIDDRAQGPGSKFADADLIGVPLRVTLGKRTISDGTVDLRLRRDGSEETLPLAQAAARLSELSKELRPK